MTTHRPVRPIAALALAGLTASVLSHAGEAPEPPEGPPPREPSSQGRFDEATRLYREAAGAEGERQDDLYREAAALYAEVAAETPNGRVLYDLGNARFRAGELGRAIAAYRRAERLLPRHGPTRANLAYARDLAPGGGPGRKPHPAAAAFLFWHYALSLAEAEVMAVLTFLALLGLLAARRFVGERVRRRLSAPAIVAGVLFGVFGLSSIAKLADSPAGEGVVVTAEARVRSEPTGRAVDLFTLREGAEVRVTDRSGNWTRVFAGADRRGWVESRAVEVLSDPPHAGR